MMVYIVILGVLILAALAYIKIAKYFNIVDRPNHRSSHKEPIIRGAGVLFYLAVLIFYFVSGVQLSFFFLGLSIIAVVSYVDDVVTLSSGLRLVFQVVAISLVTYQLSLILGFTLWITPLLIFVGVAFINMFNFMDGINGITGIYSLVVLAGLYVINNLENIVDERFIVFLILSILVFGFFNFRKKARFFCGDVGSIVLAVAIFFIATLFTIKLEAPLIILSVSVYLTDATLTIFYRKTIGEKLTEAHRHHIYQKFTDFKRFPHLKTSLLYGICQAIIWGVIYFNYKRDISFQLIIFAIIVLVLLFTYILLFRWLKPQTS